MTVLSTITSVASTITKNRETNAKHSRKDRKPARMRQSAVAMMSSTKVLSVVDTTNSVILAADEIHACPSVTQTVIRAI